MPAGEFELVDAPIMDAEIRSLLRLERPEDISLSPWFSVDSAAD